MGGNMRLRNKKTGEIVDVESVGHAESLKEKYGYQVTLSWKTEYENLSQCKDYHSLAELNEEWEDYKPKEPLIKDERIRKAVRAWAEASEITKVLSYGDYFWIGFRSVNTESVWKFECSYSDASEFELDKEYTIAELCGEEE